MLKSWVGLVTNLLALGVDVLQGLFSFDVLGFLVISLTLVIVKGLLGSTLELLYFVIGSIFYSFSWFLRIFG
jgi:hypothetical protein